MNNSIFSQSSKIIYLVIYNRLGVSVTIILPFICCLPLTHLFSPSEYDEILAESEFFNTLALYLVLALKDLILLQEGTEALKEWTSLSLPLSVLTFLH